MATTRDTALAPGARVEIRDEEWMVRAVKGTSTGHGSVHVIGVSELVQGKEAIFLSALDKIRPLLPEETDLVHDDSPRYRRSRLYLNALLRRSPATDDALYVGHRAAIRKTNYQLQPAAKALAQLRPRILMADGTGLGKTIEVGVLLSELIQRGRGDRILVVALKSILSQFQKELWARFTIPLVRLDSVGIQRVQSRIPSNMNPFYYFDKAIISIDTLKRDEKYRRYLEHCRWDVVVVDECQHVAERGTNSQRSRVAQLLARTSDALILTSATPHDGKRESFASLMNLLEPTAISNIENYTSEEVRDLFIRRFKKDVSHEVEEAFRERELALTKGEASQRENAVFEKLDSLKFKTIARERGGQGVLFRTLLLKAFLSSPAACISTVEQRLKHKDMQDAADEKVQHDTQLLNELKALLEQVEPGDFQKLQQLLQLLREHGFDQANPSERIVIFSERIATLRFLHETLKRELELPAEQIEIFHGTLDDQKQQGLVESFGTESTPIRILLASDAASEGINLHYYCSRMVHFDLPWSFITLEQRNGRIDRFGQQHTPEITYLLTIPGDEKVKGDLRVLELLIEKEDAAHKNLGDVAWLMGLHSAELEEAEIARGIEAGEAPDEIIPDEAPPTDFMKLLIGEDAPNEVDPEVKTPLRLIEDELAYARLAFDEVLEDDQQALEWHDHLSGFTLVPPEDLLRRFDYLPPELLRQEGRELKLTTDGERVMASLEEARQDERKWPEWQLCWEQHPVAEWLDDRVLGKFSRHEAPVMRLDHGVAPGEVIVLFQGMVSNHRSQPILIDWFGVRFKDDRPVGEIDLAEILQATRLDQDVPNPGGVLEEELRGRLKSLLPAAVETARSRMMRRRNERSEAIAEPLREGLRKVKRWHERSLKDLEPEQVAKASAGKLRKDQQKKLDAERDEIQKRYDFRREWISEGMRTQEIPYLRVAAVLISREPS